MFRSDAQEKGNPRDSNVSDVNIDSINIEIVCEIEKELQDSPYDIISLVFLLYDIPETALQRLIVFQRVAGDASASNLNLLQDWARRAKSNSTWKHEFLEALLICQLYGIVKKLGFHIPSVKEHYQPDNWLCSMHFNIMKKALYKVCENINSENLSRLKNTLQNCKLDVREFNSCELIFLKLMSEKFITMTQIKYDKRVLGCEFKVDKLAKILEKLPGLDNLAKQLRLLQSRTCDEPTPEVPVAASTPFAVPSDMSKPVNAPMTLDDFADVFEMMGDLKLEDENHLKSDTKKMNRDKYAIKNKQSVGICLIINQEDFCLSEKSLQDDTLTTVLAKREGSVADKMALEKTMTSLNFEVVVGDNLCHDTMIEFIKDTLRDKVKSTDSIFMLCILSHGVRGHVYAADCVKVSVEGIQSILDSDEAYMLRGIPKVLIIQACQIDEMPQSTLVADSPFNMNNYYLKKSDFLIYWATAPQYEAFRDEKSGSIFIQLLCMAIQKRGKKEHLFDIFTLVNNGVQSICRAKNCKQVPIFESTLRKKLFLQIPE